MKTIKKHIFYFTSVSGTIKTAQHPEQSQITHVRFKSFFYLFFTFRDVF